MAKKKKKKNSSKTLKRNSSKTIKTDYQKGLTQRVKITKAEYDANSDTIAWIANLEDGTQVDMVWRRDDFFPTFNLPYRSVEAVEYFNSQILGKEINLVVEPKPKI